MEIEDAELVEQSSNTEEVKEKPFLVSVEERRDILIAINAVSATEAKRIVAERFFDGYYDSHTASESVTINVTEAENEEEDTKDGEAEE